MFCGCAVQLLKKLVGNPEDIFSHDATHIPRYGNVRGFFKAITCNYLMHATVTLIRMQCDVGSGSKTSIIMF